MSDEQLMQESAARLSRSPVGRNAMRHVLEWLDEDGLLLDFQNREDLLRLLQMAWGSYAGTARDVMHAAMNRNA